MPIGWLKDDSPNAVCETNTTKSSDVFFSEVCILNENFSSGFKKAEQMQLSKLTHNNSYNKKRLAVITFYVSN